MSADHGSQARQRIQKKSGNRVRRGYEILTEDGPLEFAAASIKYGFGRLPEAQQLRLQLVERRTRHVISGNVVSDPLSYIYINPVEVQYVTPVSKQTPVAKPDPSDLQQCIFDIPYGTFGKRKRVGSVIGGDWDRKETEFSDVFIYDSFEKHFIDGVPWEETQYVQRVAEFYEERDKFKGYDSFEEFQANRLPFLDDLYKKIASGKYRTQLELGGSIFNELTVNIGRDGEIYFNSNGAHRLTMSKLAGVDQIPALVMVRHPEWQDRRALIRNCKYRSHPIPADEDLTHPDIRKVL